MVKVPLRYAVNRASDGRSLGCLTADLWVLRRAEGSGFCDLGLQG